MPVEPRKVNDSRFFILLECAQHPSTLSPELFCRQARAFGHRLKLRQNDFWMNFWFVSRLRREAAVSAGDDVFPPDQFGVTHNPLGDQFGMLDDIATVGDHAGDQQILPAGNFAVSQT